MKLKTHNGYIIDIFAVYWSGNKTFFLGMPKNHGGLIAYDKSEVEIVDSALHGSFEYFSNNLDGVYHWALIKEALLDDILERDEDAYKRFLEIIKSEGLVDPDFY